MSQANFNMALPERALAVTTSDSLPNIFTALYISVAGTVKITDRYGNVTTWTVPAGGYIWMPTSLVWQNGTSATGIIGLV